MNLPPTPGVPTSLTSGQILVIDGAVTSPSDGATTGAESVAAELFAPLLAIASPVLDTWHEGPPADLLQTHMDPPEPLPYVGNHLLLGDVDEKGVQRFVAAAGPGAPAPVMIAELRQLGGAFAAPPYPGGALDRTAAQFAHVAIGVVMPGQDERAVSLDLRRIGEALAPWNTGLTLPSVVEAHAAPQRTFDDPTAAHVAAVRKRYDSDGVFAGDVDPIRDTDLSRPT